MGPGSGPPALSARRPLDEHRAALGRAAGVGAVCIPAWAALDVFMAATLFPAADLVVVFGLRACATAVSAGAWWIARDRRFSDRAARLAHVACVAIIALAISGIAFHFGGPSSIYVHGLSVVVMVRLAAVPAPTSEAIGYGALIAGTYPALFATLYALDPGAHAHWLDGPELAVASAQYLLVIAVIGVSAVASRTAWNTQRQLFHARRLGNYRLQVRIGQGGQGEVWLARDTQRRANVALKVLRSSAATATAVQLFEREATLASKLESPHTVRIFDFGASDDGVYYLAMEHLDGADLATLVGDHGAMTPARVIHFAIQACRSLEEAHGKGFIHRDVKPSNLFAAKIGDTHDHLKLLDFGVARSLADERSDLTRTGTVRGTPAYMAPEACRGEATTPASDVYSLGATLYHLLVGAPPFSGDPAELIAQHLDREPDASGARARAIDPDLEQVVMRCLAKAPSQRPASALELRHALERCAGAGAWSAEHADAFWRGPRRAAVAAWQAETVV
jgi:hypothetical protein